MAPVISSPTPIVGVKTAGGKPAQRLPIDVFRTQHEFAFALYVQALAAWQKNGNDKFDQDNANGTSYFQVSGKSTQVNVQYWHPELALTRSSQASTEFPMSLGRRTPQPDQSPLLDTAHIAVSSSSRGTDHT